jgi:hypothetical protein
MGTYTGRTLAIIFGGLLVAAALPESPGFYAQQDGQLKRLEQNPGASPENELSAGVQFILSPAIPAERMMLERIAFLRYEFLINSPAGNKRNDLNHWNFPKSNRSEPTVPNTRVELRRELVATHPDVVEITPANPLSPGYYRMTVGDRVFDFAVRKQQIDPYESCFDLFTEPLAAGRYAPCNRPAAQGPM